MPQFNVCAPPIENLTCLERLSIYESKMQLHCWNISRFWLYTVVQQPNLTLLFITVTWMPWDSRDFLWTTDPYPKLPFLRVLAPGLKLLIFLSSNINLHDVCEGRLLSFLLGFKLWGYIVIMFWSSEDFRVYSGYHPGEVLENVNLKKNINLQVQGFLSTVKGA